LIREQGWQRILARRGASNTFSAVDLAPRQVAGLAGHAQLVFGAIVKGFQVGVRQRPVGKRRAFRDG